MYYLIANYSSHAIVLSKGTIFAKKMLIFCKKDAEISKIKEVLILKRVLDTWGNFTSPFTPKRTPKKPTQIRVDMCISSKLE